MDGLIAELWQKYCFHYTNGLRLENPALVSNSTTPLEPLSISYLPNAIHPRCVKLHSVERRCVVL